jgi:hypothetical protein
MTETKPQRPYNRPPYGAAQSNWVGLVVFAGVMLLMLGSFQAIEGFVALFRDDFFVTSASGLVFTMDYTAWGWTHLAIGLVALAAGAGILYGQMWARIIGIIVAVLSALANIAFLPAYPIWSTITITTDVLVIYALTAHGREVRN